MHSHPRLHHLPSFQWGISGGSKHLVARPSPNRVCRMVFFEGPEFYHDFAEPHEHDNIVQGGLLVREAKDSF